jgi:hypothetical protein
MYKKKLIGCKSTKNQKLTIAVGWDKCYFYIKFFKGSKVQRFKGSRVKGSKFKVQGSKVQSLRVSG